MPTFVNYHLRLKLNKKKEDGKAKTMKIERIEGRVSNPMNVYSMLETDSVTYFHIRYFRSHMDMFSGQRVINGLKG